MRVAVDAREIEDRPTGVGRVLQGLLTAWPIDELVLISRVPIGLPAAMAGRARVETRVAASGRRLPGALWEHTALPGAVTAAGADALLAVGYGMPWRCPVPAAVCMHDCAPFALPEEFSWREGWRRRWNARHAARRAAFLFMGSQFAAEQAYHYLQVPTARCLVAPWGLADGFRPPSPAAVAAVAAAHGVDRSCVLFVGSAFRRRGLAALARRVEAVARHLPGTRLVVAGRDAGPDGRIPGVGYLGYVPEADLPGLYAACGVVAYPSTYEGFGLPLLEAMACGARVVGSRCEALVEVFGNHAVLADHDSDEDWIAALRAALSEPDPEAEARRRWARGHGWDDTASQVRDRLARAVEAAV